MSFKTRAGGVVPRMGTEFFLAAWITLMSSAVKALVRAIQEPAVGPPLRLPGYPSIEASGAVKYRQKVTYTVSAPGTYTPPRVMMLRQPSFPLWGDTSHSACWAVGSRFSMESVAGPSSTPSGSFEADLGATGATGTYKSILSPQPAGGAAYTYSIRTVGSGGVPIWGDNVPLIGRTRNSPRPWLYIPADLSGVTQSVDVALILFRATGQTTGAITAPVRLTVEYWQGPGMVEQFTYQATFTTQTAMTPNYASLAVARVSMAAGFMRLVDINIGDADTGTTWNPPAGVGAPGPEFVDVWITAPGGATWSVSNTNVTASPAASAGFLPLIPPLDFRNDSVVGPNLAPLTRSRQTAAAVHFQNITKVMNKEGSVSAARLPFSTDIFEYTLGDLNVPPMKSYFAALEAGLYSYILPTASEDWADYLYRDSISAAWFAAVNLDVPSEANCLAFSDPDGATSLMLTHDQHVEFVTSSQAWNPTICRTTVETLHQAILSCIAANTFWPGPRGRRQDVGRVLATRPARATNDQPRKPRRQQQAKKKVEVATQTQKHRPKPKPKAQTKPGQRSIGV